MDEQKKELIASINGATEYIVMCVDGQTQESFVYAKDATMTAMIIEFFNRFPNIYTLMLQCKMANEIQNIASATLGEDKAADLMHMLMEVMQAEASKEGDSGDDSEGNNTMDDMQDFMRDLFKDNNK
jgi:hypothetical protein